MVRRNPGPRAILDTKCSSWPLFYRLKGIDLFLAGYLAGALLLFLFRGRLGPAGRVNRLMLLNSFLVLVLCLNRAAYLFAGRGQVVSERLNRVLRSLLASGSLDLREFSCRTAIPLSLLRVEVDRVMANNFLLGYFSKPELRIVVDDNPLKEGICPGCGCAVSAEDRSGRICSGCGSVFYI